MNCRDLHSYFEQNPSAGMQSDGSVVGQHISDCADCHHFVEEQRRLQQRLRLVRESVLPASQSMDAAVLAAYRRHMAEQNQVGPAGSDTRRATPAWKWALAAAVIVSMAGLYLSMHMHTPHQPVAVQENALPAMVSPKGATAIAQTRAAETSKPVMASTSSKRMAHPAGSSMGYLAAHAALPRTAPVQSRNSIEQEFQSLMYCDPLSCAGAMELIHVQLPSAFVARSPSRSGDFVNADVLVGPDGIARGIRIEE